MGGTDDPDNIIELSVEEHAEAHKILYEQYGHWQDLVAFKGLLGLITTDECRYIAMIEGGKKGSKISNAKRKKSLTGKYIDTGIPSPYPKGIDGRKIRNKRYWFNNGITEGQYSLEDHPQNWMRGRLRSVMKKVNPFVIDNQ